MKKKLSIITICYNSESTIRNTISSVVSQKTDEIEYLIIDGGSTDNTQDIVKGFGSEIDYYISEPDSGISDAFNKGINRASGEWIGIINSDDEYLPGAFDQFFERVDQNVDVFYGNGVRRFANGKYKKYNANPDYNSLHMSMQLVHPSVFVKKNAYIKYGLFDISYKYVMDRELLLRFLNNGATFQYDTGYYSIYSMGGMSEKYYINGVIPEAYRIDISDGQSSVRARLKSWYLIIRIIIAKRLDTIKKDKGYISLNEVSLK